MIKIGRLLNEEYYITAVEDKADSNPGECGASVVFHEDNAKDVRSKQYDISSTRQISISPWEMMSLHLQYNSSTRQIYIKLRRCGILLI